MDPRNSNHLAQDRTSLSPLLAKNTRVDPTDSLEKYLHIDQQTEALRKVLDVVLDMERCFRAALVIAPDPSSFRPRDERDMQKRVGRQGSFFLMNEAGTHLFEATPNDRHSSWIGAFTRGTAEGMEMQRRMGGVLLQRQTEGLGAFVQASPGDLVVATAAGSGHENAALQRHVRARNGFFLCHDIVPEAARAAARDDRLRDIPYAVLPPHPQLLAPVLRSHPGQRTLVAHNLLSVCRLQDLEQLIMTAAEGGANRIVLSQSSAFMEQTHLVPQEYHVGQSVFSRHFQKMFDAEIRANRLPENVVEYNNGLIVDQACRTFDYLCWEMVRRVIMDLALQHGFEHSKTFHVTRAQIMPRQEMTAVLRRFRTREDLCQACEHGAYNAYASGPLHERYYTDQNVPSGSVRQVATELVFVVHNGQEQLVSLEAAQADEVSVIASDQSCVPPEWRLMDKRREWIGSEDDPNGTVRATVAHIVHTILFERLAREGHGKLFAPGNYRSREEHRTLANRLREI